MIEFIISDINDENLNLSPYIFCNQLTHGI
jgi:hypothetical protein